MKMDMYLHDSADTFRIVLKGELTEAGARQVGWAWETAKSILKGKELKVEISGVSNTHPAGIDLLSRMYESGARIITGPDPKCEELLRFSEGGSVAPVLRQPHRRFWRRRLLRPQPWRSE